MSIPYIFGYCHWLFFCNSDLDILSTILCGSVRPFFFWMQEEMMFHLLLHLSKHPENHHSRVWCFLHAQLRLMLLEACMSKSFSSIVNVCFGIVSLAFFGVSACTWGSWSYFLCSVDTVLYRRIPCDLVFCCWHIINSLLEAKRCVASTADTLAVSHNMEKIFPMIIWETARVSAVEATHLFASKRLLMMCQQILFLTPIALTAST